MKKAIAALTVLVLLTMGLTAAELARADQSSAIHAQAADIGTTAVGLAMGATESNPLGLAALGVKAVAYRHIATSPPIEQPRLWSYYEAFGWGATVNNLCVIAVIATGGASALLCPLLGLGAGAGVAELNSADVHRATFDAICADAKARNPSMVCIYNGS